MESFMLLAIILCAGLLVSKVSTQDTVTSLDGMVRLTDVVRIACNVIEGKVEVNSSDVNNWVTLCEDTPWNEDDTALICKKLGYEDSFPLMLSIRGQYSHIFHCIGTESSLLDCPITDYIYHCDTQLGVICIGQTVIACNINVDVATTDHIATATMPTDDSSESIVGIGVLSGILFPIIFAISIGWALTCLMCIRAKKQTTGSITSAYNTTSHNNGSHLQNQTHTETDTASVSSPHSQEPHYATLEHSRNNVSLYEVIPPESGQGRMASTGASDTDYSMLHP